MTTTAGLAETRYQAAMTRRLRRLGLAGTHAWVSLNKEGIGLHGQESGDVLLRFERIARLRVGYAETRFRTIPLCWLWLRDEAKPLELGAVDGPAHGRWMRMAVAHILDRHPRIEIVTGNGLFAPIFLLTTMGLLALVCLAFAGYMMATGNDWTVMLGALAVALAMVGVGVFLLQRYRDRPVRQVADLARGLRHW